MTAQGCQRQDGEFREYVCQTSHFPLNALQKYWLRDERISRCVLNSLPLQMTLQSAKSPDSKSLNLLDMIW